MYKEETIEVNMLEYMMAVKYTRYYYMISCSVSSTHFYKKIYDAGNDFVK